MDDNFSVAELGIRSRDFDACLDFYRLLIGQEIRFLSGLGEDGKPWRVAFFQLGGGARLTLADTSFRRPNTAQTSVGFHLHSPDPEAVEARLRAAGVVIESGTHTTSAGNRMFFVSDPDGNEMSIGTRGDLPPG